MAKIKLVLHYDLEGYETLEEVNGESLGEMIGQESALEIISSLDELEKEAIIQLIDDEGKIIKERKIKIHW